MTDEELVHGILEGYSLRTFMVPDPAMPNNSPEHMESYELPLVIIKGNHFWGKTENGHLHHVPGDAPYGLNAFCYTNAADIFCAIRAEDGLVALMRKDRYKTHEWTLVRNYKLVWDSGGDQPVEAVAKDIEAGAKFKIALLDRENIWNVHPVDLPKFDTLSGLFQLETCWDRYPTVFRQGSFPENALTTVHNSERDMGTMIEPGTFEAFYSVFSDGTYYNFYDIHRNTKQDYKRLKVYSDNVG